VKTRLFEVASEDRRRILERLTDELRRAHGVVFAYVHGSFLAGGPFHDIDVAVYLAAPDKASQALDLAGRLSQVTGYPIDVRVLNEAPVPFQFKALQGTLLVSRDDRQLADFIERVGPRYLDIAPIMRRAAREAFVR